MTSSVIFFFNDTATTEIYTLSLHDALPISAVQPGGLVPEVGRIAPEQLVRAFAREYHLDVLARRLGQEKGGQDGGITHRLGQRAGDDVERPLQGGAGRPGDVVDGAGRSEERRVGEEC